ncbi:PP2C family protein-serine/threonine phosphatase [Cellulomonas fimi]|uniref:PP2C family protein-serine/threonine phosphatase n=1 Tax=Cellulomonas fimi TaxID=1708 RepID=UPI0002F72B69|nr:GAF domain-containing SpoIIE family protein phosphatase [Cellulomonas fimi]NNH08745.1 SpoIIE family protein phosphatase [Cellulomonas fimi]VEH33354.1 Stage II sporulation protein E (SpoIIE) [Cellulomonas fimi]
MHDGTADRSLLSDVLAQLAQTLDAEVAVSRLARLLVPTLADWCLVTLVDDDESRAPRRRLRDVGWWHHDPARHALVAEYAATRIASLASTSMLMRAVDEGEVVHVHSDAVAALDRVLLPGRARDIVGQLAPSSLTVAPLQVRGRTLGALSLFNDDGRPALSAAEVALVSEVAASAALALDNARLYRQQRDVASTFQRSLLTEPVEPDHLQVVVRYQPAAEAARVGGDWYDAFLQPDGATVLVIGDVVGHDIEAAALMAQLRSMLRAVAVVTRDGPAAVLRHLDAAIRTLQLPAMATVLVARVEQTSAEQGVGLTRLRWSSAGHPPPMVLEPDGSVRRLDALTGPLLGLDPDRERREHETVLTWGSTVLLYTDGLVERRTRSLRLGLDELRDALVRHAALDLDGLCDALLAELPGGPGEDDIALVAVRLHPQDRPRPVEAGPRRVPPGVPGPRELPGG